LTAAAGDTSPIGLAGACGGAPAIRHLGAASGGPPASRVVAFMGACLYGSTSGTTICLGHSATASLTLGTPTESASQEARHEWPEG